MVSDGLMTSGVMLVAEALGYHEAKQAQALVGPSGFLLGRLMSRKRWKREEFAYANSLYCRPESNNLHDGRGLLPWAEAALNHCPYMDEEIDRRKPKCIVALGEIAFRKLTGEHTPMMASRGYVFRERFDRCWVVPAFHPSYVLRGQYALALTLMMDLEKAVRIAQEGFAYEDISCLMDPPLSDWEDFVQRTLARIRASAPLAFDIETPYKAQFSEDEDELELEADLVPQIDRSSFSADGEEGASVPWRMPYLVGVRTLLAEAVQSSTAIAWNLPFDRPRVSKALELPMPLERCRDTMDAFHVLYNALPRKLGFATSCLPSSHRLRMWKHLSQLKPAYYSTMDAIALWRNDRDIMHLLAQTGQQSIFEKRMIALAPVLEFMTSKGLLVDQEAHAALAAEVERQMSGLRGEMDAVTPREVRSVKVWKSLEKAEAGLAILKERGEVDSEAVLEVIKGEKVVRRCGVCGTYPVKMDHVRRKTLKGVEMHPLLEEGVENASL